jgi:DNA polymerase-3 subunit delta'
MIIGHKTQWEFLKKLVESERIPQALLFVGEDSLGKRKIALEFIKLLNCQEKDIKLKPCQTCFSCTLIEKNKHPDVILLAPKESRSRETSLQDKKEIQISQIRDLKKSLNLRPQFATQKAVIINDAHTLNSQAQNCLLKTIEEPRGKVLFSLITSHPEMLLETVRSRCETLKFYPVHPQEMIKHLKKFKISNSQLRKILSISEGRPGRFIDFLEDPQKLTNALEIFEAIQKLLDSDILQRFSFAKNFFEKRNSSLSLPAFLEEMERYLRSILLVKLKVKNEFLNSFFETSRISPSYSFLRIKEMIDSVENFKFLVSQTNINPKLAFEALMLVI